MYLIRLVVLPRGEGGKGGLCGLSVLHELVYGVTNGSNVSYNSRTTCPLFLMACLEEGNRLEGNGRSEKSVRIYVLSLIPCVLAARNTSRRKGVLRWSRIIVLPSNLHFLTSQRQSIPPGSPQPSSRSGTQEWHSSICPQILPSPPQISPLPLCLARCSER